MYYLTMSRKDDYTTGNLLDYVAKLKEDDG